MTVHDLLYSVFVDVLSHIGNMNKVKKKMKQIPVSCCFLLSSSLFLAPYANDTEIKFE